MAAGQGSTHEEPGTPFLPLHWRGISVTRGGAAELRGAGAGEALPRPFSRA